MKDFGSCNTTEIANLLGLTRHSIQTMVKDGTLPPLKNGKMPTEDGVQAYIKFVREQNKLRTKTAAQQANTEARTKVLDLRIARERGELIPMERAEAAVIGQCAHFRVGLDSLPARLSRDDEERKRIEAEIDIMLAELARDTRQRRKALETDRDSADASEEDDAG